MMINRKVSAMRFRDFIQKEIIIPLLKKNGVGVLVVYDPDIRYRELCLELSSETLRVIDATESSIISRELALNTFIELGSQGTKLEGLIVYVPARAPISDEEKQKDPFALYTVCGSVFPNPEKDGDSYFELCKVFKPDYTTEIIKIFNDNPNPQFAVIDAVGGGTGWPNLQALLGLDSSRDIIYAILAPSELQKQRLTEQDTWILEARDLLAICLGLKLITHSKNWEVISDELWRYLLYSEFAFDLDDIPAPLKGVPRAAVEARPLIESLCDRLRNDQRTRSLYIDKAEAIEKDLNLQVHCQGIKNFGVRDTFPFEERSFLYQAIEAFTREDTDAVRQIVARHQNSVWMGKGESQAQWSLIQAAFSLCEKCNDFDGILPSYKHDMNTLINFYTNSLREVDRCQREFEQAVNDSWDVQQIASEIILQARNHYRHLMGRVQDSFIRHLEKTGWPLVGRLSNSDIFDRMIASNLQQSGYRVAYFLIDALRYELGVELEKQLADDGKIEIQTAMAQLPTVTLVGMASLLPEAGSSLSLANQENSIIPMLGDTKLTNVNQRMDIFRKKYGQRFAETTLSQFLRSAQKIPETVDLLILRSDDIDSQFEASPEFAFRSIYDTLKRIRVAINRLKNMGFREAIIATDHGFCLNFHSEAGDICAKPSGNWINIHDRLLLGNGTADGANFVLPVEHLGIRGDFAQVAGPRSLVPYRGGTQYFHGGVSLQECVIPVLSIRLERQESNSGKPIISLSYKNGAKRITSRFPVVEINLQAYDLFSTEYEILIEAQDMKGNVVGEARAGGYVNPATGTITLKPGDTKQITIKMQIDFEGKFMIKAMNPTTLVGYSQIDLETDYVDGV